MFFQNHFFRTFSFFSNFFQIFFQISNILSDFPPHVLKALKDRDANVRRTAEKMLSGVIYHTGEKHVMRVAMGSDFDVKTQADNDKAVTKAKEIVPVIVKPKKVVKKVQKQDDSDDEDFTES